MKVNSRQDQGVKMINVIEAIEKQDPISTKYFSL
jgi:hypothetical protein